MTRILVAGVGNVFRGDDGFGVAVAQHLASRPHSKDVQVVDFGIRGIDLAFALLEGYDATILVDTLARGGDPGTLYVVEPDADPGWPRPDGAEAHDLHPARVLQLVRAMGGKVRGLVVVGCEPATLGDDGAVALSPSVEAALPEAVELVESLVARLRSEVLSPGRRRAPRRDAETVEGRGVPEGIPRHLKARAT